MEPRISPPVRGLFLEGEIMKKHKISALLLAMVLLSFFLQGCKEAGAGGTGSMAEAQSSSYEKEGESEPLFGTQPLSDGVTVTVDCSAALDEGYTVPGNSAILLSETIFLKEGDTVLSVLQRACTQGNISLSASGSYVAGIGGLSEKDCGPASGWTYTVNGNMPSVGAGAYRLSAGDAVCWNYVLRYE